MCEQHTYLARMEATGDAVLVHGAATRFQAAGALKAEGLVLNAATVWLHARNGAHITYNTIGEKLF